jgi:hypothetical protein
MRALGFHTCDLAANGQQAFLRAMEDMPDIVLMDAKAVTKGSRLLGGCARYATCLSSSSPATLTVTPSSVSMK